MAAPTTWARRSRCGKSRVSWTLAAEGMAPSGVPSVATTTWYLVPALPRSVGSGPVSSPPRPARTERLSTTTSQGATSGPARTIRTRATWTRRGKAVAPRPSGRRRRVEPRARSAAARGPRHRTPPRTGGAQRPDDPDRRPGRPPGPGPPALDPGDDPRHQSRRRRHARLPVPPARETGARGAGCREPDELVGSGNRLLVKPSPPRRRPRPRPVGCRRGSRR